MSNRTDIVVETDNAEGQVLLSASRVYDLTEDKTQDTINGEIRNTLNQLDQNMAYVESGNTASRTYTGGEFISWKGNLYTASTAIPQNDPFTVGTNLTAVPEGGLNKLESSLSDILKSSATSVNFTDSGQQFTAPAAGILCGYWRKSSAESIGGVAFNSSVKGSAFYMNTETVSDLYFPICFPVAKGEIITVSTFVSIYPDGIILKFQSFE